MVQELGALGEALEPEATLWRFMDFTKYVSMLHRRALFFSRADELPDPFEGLSARRGDPVARRDQRAGELSLRRQVLLSCWHRNEHESAAMWRIYLSADEGVAIRSSTARLRNALSGLEETLYLGCVRYVDPLPDLRAGAGELDVFFCKRKSFDYEREARVLWRRPTAQETGQYLQADLDELIAEIVVSPLAEPWFEELVSSVSEKYGYALSVRRSSLLDSPDRAPAR